VAVGRTHRLATTSSVEADELEPEGWVVGSKDPGEGLLGAWEENDWSPRINFVVRDWMAKLGLVAAGLGVTLVPGLSAAVVPDEIALVRIADQRASRPVSLARPVGGDANPTIDAAADAFRLAAGEIALEVDRRR
jgi:DNA-binding transcriptional LysR family regulator